MRLLAIFIGCVLGWVLLGDAGQAAQKELPEQVSFNAHIRPIMSNTCFACHGPDEEENESGFRLDSFAGATSTLESDDQQHGIVPGDPEASEVYLRITGQSDGEQMPPEDFRHQLDEHDKALFRKWIQQGAKYQQHWSYSPIKRPQPPSSDSTAESFGPIDNFILDHLAQAGLTPGRLADKRTLIRRLSLDLLGLPPTPKQVREFIDDDSDDAYRRLVNRMLQSPHFGERMAVTWLDLVRFADTVGFHGDQNQRIFPYRDYIIDSFNENKPFDQFTREQLAGDLFPEPTQQQLVATGFMRLNMVTREGGAQPDEYLAKYKADRVRAIGTVWLGATLGCCECHNHKYDPFTAKNFYSLGAFFDDLQQWGVYSSYKYSPNPDLRGFTNEYPFPPEMKLKSRSLEREVEYLRRQRDRKLAEYLSSKPELINQDAQQCWLAGLKAVIDEHPSGWIPLEPIRANSSHKTSPKILSDGTVRLLGKGHKEEVITITAKIPSMGSRAMPIPVNALRLELLPDQIHGGKVGRGPDGSFAVSVNVAAQRTDLPPPQPIDVRPQFVRISLAGEKRVLTLAEVQVFARDEEGNETNIAEGMPATQSSNHNKHFAKFAVDGNTDGHAYQASSITHTKNQTDPWWEVDLGAKRALTRIEVWNRTDGNYLDRLSGFRIELLDADRHRLVALTPSTPKPSIEVPVPATVTPTDETDVVISWAQADRRKPLRYQSGAESFELESVWRSGPVRWQLPQNETSLAHTAVYHLDRPRQFQQAEVLKIRLKSKDIGRVRLSVTPIGQPIAGWDAVSDGLHSAIHNETPERTQSDQATLTSAFYRSTMPFADQHELSRRYRDEIGKLHGAMATTLVAQRIPEDKLPVSRVLPRGNWQDKSGELAPPGFPHFLPQLKSGSQFRLSRMDLADWLVSPDNPLTARHFVNRTWQQFFGKGLSGKLDDLGNQGEWPSHPDLLDWLASEFIASGWDVKHIIRQIVLSRTYRQAAAVRDNLREIDPYNRLLAQQSARRLDAEMVRDNALSAAGLLSLDWIGGMSVFPYQPDGHYRDLQFPDRKYRASQDGRQYRRGVYMHWQRTFLHPMLVNFDAPSRDECTAQRIQSNSPQQALTLLNDPTFAEASRAMAASVIQGHSDAGFDGWLNNAFERTLVRLPARAERKTLRGLFEKQQQYFADHPSDANAFLNNGQMPIPAEIDRKTLAAFSQVCRVILNLHETITRY